MTVDVMTVDGWRNDSCVMGLGEMGLGEMGFGVMGLGVMEVGVMGTNHLRTVLDVDQDKKSISTRNYFNKNYIQCFVLIF